MELSVGLRRTVRVVTRFGLLAAVLLLGTNGALRGQEKKTAPASEPEVADCSQCHDQGPKHSKSAHASVACITCHVKHEQFPHAEGTPKPACSACHQQEAAGHESGVHGLAAKAGKGAPDCALCHADPHETAPTKTLAYEQQSVDTCGICHSEMVEQFKSSIHGQALARGITDAPTCSSCHGAHKIVATSSANSPVKGENVVETCGNCHGDVRLNSRFGIATDRISSFERSFHGSALKAGSSTVADCASCHGHHDILPSTDPKSKIHVKNLGKTCGQCHPGAGERFAITTIHLSEGGKEPPPVIFVRKFYWLVIPLTLGFMLLHHFSDYLRKLWRARFRPQEPEPSVGVKLVPGSLRMYPWERVQHGLLAVSFMVLAWTGFALSYPNEWWARPLTVWEATYPVRGVVHRTAAVVMLICSGLHVYLLATNTKLRKHWLTLLPTVNDVTDVTKQMLYNLGLSKQKPVLPAHSYIEKLEYWAVAWGTIVMAVSGGLLWANNWSLRFLPKVILDAAGALHYYEAVLATLAIVVWHFYSVIFDPEVYPMDPAWLTGRTVRKHPVDHLHDDEPVARKSVM